MSKLEQFYKFISAHAEKTSNDRILCELCNEVIKRKYIPDHSLKCEKRKRFTPVTQPIISPQPKALIGGKPIITEVRKQETKSILKPRPSTSIEIRSESRPESRPENNTESKPQARPSTSTESRSETKPQARPSTSNEPRKETKPQTRPSTSNEPRKETRSETRPSTAKESRLVPKKSEDIWIKEDNKQVSKDIIANISDGSSDEFISILTECNINMEWSDTSSDELDTILTITESMGKIKNSYNRLNVPAKPIKLLPAEFKIKYSAMDRDRKHKLKKLYKFFQTCEEESKAIPKQFVKFDMPSDKKFIKHLIKADEEELSSKIDTLLGKYSSVL